MGEIADEHLEHLFDTCEFCGNIFCDCQDECEACGEILFSCKCPI